MNTKQLAISALSVSLFLVSFDAAPARAQFLKKLLQGVTQQQQYPNNQFGQSYQNGYDGFNPQFSGGNQPYGGYQPGFNGSGFNGSGFNRSGFNGSTANFSANINSLDSNADQISNRMQKFLQATGRWYPQPKGNDMQACVAMQAVKQQLGQLKRSAGGNITPQLQMQLTQLQQSANNLVNSMQTARIDPGAIGQAQVFRDNVSQMMAMSSIAAGGNAVNPFWNGGQPYYGSPMLHVNQSGRGQLNVMGQQYMRFRDVSLETIDPVSRRVRATFSGGRDGVILSGPITNQTMNGITVAVDSSDKGAVSGVLNVNFVSNGSVGSISSTGQMNGQGYVIQFSGQ